MSRRWAIGGVWAFLVSAGLFACSRNAAAEQSTKPEKIIISEVIITGNQRMSTEQIKVRLRTKAGDEYKEAVINDDVRELYKTGQFSNIITWLQPDQGDRSKVFLGVREMPNMVQKVTFLGAKHIKQEELYNITGVRPSTPLNPNLNHLGCLKILEKYAEMGRSFADCQLIKGGDLADNEVVYEISEGPKVTVRDIRFVGDFNFISAARLMTRAKSSRQWFHHIDGIYNKQLAEVEVGVLYHFFRSFGFQDVHISLESQRSAGGSEVALIFHIQEGPRYRVQDVPDVNCMIQDVPGVYVGKEMPREQLIALSSFKPGDYLDEATLKQAIKAITDYMFRCGRIVRVCAIPVWITPDKPGVCNIRYEVIEQLPCRIDSRKGPGGKQRRKD